MLPMRIDPIKTIEGFRRVFVRNGIITWPSGYDIDPYFLMETAEDQKSAS